VLLFFNGSFNPVLILDSFQILLVVKR